MSKYYDSTYYRRRATWSTTVSRSYSTRFVIGQETNPYILITMSTGVGVKMR